MASALEENLLSLPREPLRKRHKVASLVKDHHGARATSVGTLIKVGSASPPDPTNLYVPCPGPISVSVDVKSIGVTS